MDADDSDSDAEVELRVASELADARLGVAEELGWPLAVLAAVAAHLASSNWLITVPVGLATYYFVTLKYRRESAAAEDRYYRVARLGKYCHQKSDA